MRLTTKSEYALICLKYLCEHANGEPISVAEVAQAEHLPKVLRWQEQLAGFFTEARISIQLEAVPVPCLTLASPYPAFTSAALTWVVSCFRVVVVMVSLSFLSFF